MSGGSMSGGRFNYADFYLKSEMFGWADEPYNVMEDGEISELVWDVLNLIHDLDCYQSGDTCRETYIESKKEFKKKWFGNRDERLEKIVDRKIEELKTEIAEMIGETE